METESETITMNSGFAMPNPSEYEVFELTREKMQQVCKEISEMESRRHSLPYQFTREEIKLLKRWDNGEFDKSERSEP